MVFIVPTFMDAFKEMNLEMPLITVIVVGISDWLIQFWYLLILGLLVLVVGLHYFYKNNKEFHYAVNVFYCVCQSLDSCCKRILSRE